MCFPTSMFLMDLFFPPLPVEDGVSMNISAAVLCSWGKRREWYNVLCGDEGKRGRFTVVKTWQEHWNTTYCHAVRLETFRLLLLISGQVKRKLPYLRQIVTLVVWFSHLCVCWMPQNDFWVKERLKYRF